MTSAQARPPSEVKESVYFDLGLRLVQEFSGTYEFKYRRLEFGRTDAGNYAIKSSGDQSPSEDKLAVDGDSIRWILGWSGEEWLVFRLPLRVGDEWQHTLRSWSQRYRVTDADLTVSVPAGEFTHCARVTISWVADEHDMRGPQQRVLYLAPHLGIIKQELWSGGVKYHEEVLTAYSRRSEQ